VRNLIACSCHRTGHDTGPTTSHASRRAPPEKLRLGGPRPPSPPTRSYTGGTAAVVTAPFPPADWPRPTAFAKSRRPNCRPTHSSSTLRGMASFPPSALTQSPPASSGLRADDNPSAHPLKLRPSWDDHAPPRTRPVPRSLDGSFSRMRHGTAPSRPLLRVGVPRQSSSGSAPPTHPARRPSAPLSPQPPLSPRLSAPADRLRKLRRTAPPSPASGSAPPGEARRQATTRATPAPR